MDKNMMRKAQQQVMQMQKDMARIQEELGNETVESTAGGGAVTVVMTGHRKVRSIKIDPDVVDKEDVEMLEDLIISAINEATDKAEDHAQKRMAAVTGSLGGFGGLLG